MSIVALAIALALCLLAVPSNALDYGRVMVPLGHREEDAPLSFGASWQVLGPFQIGTRGMTLAAY
jgi:hypothetical protein